MAIDPKYAVEVDLAFYQGDDFSEEIEFVDNDLTGVSIAGSARRGTRKVDFVVTMTNESLGQFKIALPRAVTATMQGEWDYDIQVTDSLNERLTRIYGKIYVKDDVTI